jgi:hypothetical protein
MTFTRLQLPGGAPASDAYMGALVSVWSSVAMDTLALKSTDFVVECRVGRLIVTRLSVLRDPKEVGRVQLAIKRAIEETRNKAVICSDWRSIDIFAPAVADAVLEMLNVTNREVLRGGILMNAEKATFSLQVERVLRDAGNPGRKCFREKGSLLHWLGASLDTAEVEAARSFLNE